MLACHVFVFFGKVSVQIFDSIFNQVACFLIVGVLKSFCIFWISPLCVICKYFLPVCSFLIILTLSFAG